MLFTWENTTIIVLFYLSLTYILNVFTNFNDMNINIFIFIIKLLFCKIFNIVQDCHFCQHQV